MKLIHKKQKLDYNNDSQDGFVTVRWEKIKIQANSNYNETDQYTDMISHT